MGSDEEKIILNAINQSQTFKPSVHQSSKRQWQALSYKDGCGAKKRETMIKSIFGHDGFIVLIRFLLNQNLPIWIVFLSNFRNNFQKRLKPPQYDHVLPPLQNGTLNKL